MTHPQQGMMKTRPIELEVFLCLCMLVVFDHVTRLLDPRGCHVTITTEKRKLADLVVVLGAEIFFSTKTFLLNEHF